MANVLALDATADACSATILTSVGVSTLMSETPRTHAQKLLPMIDGLFRKSGLTLADFDCIAFAHGPGSFTGLRICLGIAQGLSFGCGIPLVGVSGLEALGHEACTKYTGVANGAIVVLDARMGELYWAAYGVTEGTIQPILAPRLQALAEAEADMSHLVESTPLHKFVVVGPGLNALTNEGRQGYVAADATMLPSSEWIARIGEQLWYQGAAVKAEEAELVYLRNSVSWNKRQRIRS